jgi:predicted ATPase/DNA-binding CsgD family transcriptional regulator
MADRVGQQLGNYRLVTLLGQGGFAEVYLGRHVRLPLQAAIKVLQSHVTGQEVERFQQEAETIARLVHPSIVRILDYAVQEGVPFLTMDYAPNGSLRRRYSKGTVVPLPEIVSSVKQIAAALQYAHEQNVIHRDVKPENMLLGRHQEVLLSDFGLAALAHSSASLSTQEAMGTLPYMAPEQIEGHPRAASDQYALGVVVYEWLCGSRPFEGSPSEVLVQQLTMPPPPLHERVPTIPSEVEQIVLRALAKDPKLRFARVQDFALALEVACTGDSPGSTRLMLASGYAAESRLTTKHHLPAYLTPLIGREQEIVEACTLLRRPEVRLVTLTGPGGIGKTRLAVQVATELVADFDGGVSFVSLAPISDPELVIPAIAQTLDVKESGTRPLMDLLKAFLQDKYVLLVLDNFEHLLPAAPQLADLLTSCPHLKLLVTSRAALHLQGEHEFLVSPLALPDLTHLPEQEVLSQYAAVALFLQRAQAVKPALQLMSSNARLIAEICTRLDGLPLAIELAAARIKLLPPQALLTRLSQRLHLLTGGAQDAPARQQTLRNTIAWSYQLLDADEQQLFRRLAVFVGGCTLEAIEVVCAALDTDAAALPVLDAVASLIDKSLLQQTELEREEPRLVMLETIREYGLEVFEASGEMEATQYAHARYYLTLAEEAEPELVGPQQTMWLERLEREYDNLRAVLQWSLERREVGPSREMALRLAGALQRFWDVHGHWSEGRNFLERVLAGSEGGAAPAQVKALKASACLAYRQSDIDRAEVLYEECLARCRVLGDTAGIALSLRLLGGIAGRRGNFVVESARTEESLALFREVGDTEGIAWSLYNLAEIASRQGEYDRAISLKEESLAIFREMGHTEGIGASLLKLAEVLFHSQDDPAKVQTLLEEALVLCREMGHKEGFARALQLLAEVFLQQGDAVKARSLVEESMLLSRELGEQDNTWLLITLGKVAENLSDYQAARASYEESLAIGGVGGDNLNTPFSLEGLAGVVAVQGDPAWAVQLWGVAAALREARGTPIPPVYRFAYECSVAAARAQLGEKAFVALWQEGRTMTAEQALAAQGRTLAPTATPIPPAATSAPPAKSPTTYPAGLTVREVEVLRLVAQGLTDAQVAEQLVINSCTVNTHLTSIYGKIGVSSRSAATRYAIEHQLF